MIYPRDLNKMGKKTALGDSYPTTPTSFGGSSGGSSRRSRRLAEVRNIGSERYLEISSTGSYSVQKGLKKVLLGLGYTAAASGMSNTGAVDVAGTKIIAGGLVITRVSCSRLSSMVIGPLHLFPFSAT
jgi:hypothetical protein